LQTASVPYYDRAAIEAGALDGQKVEICWLKDPLDLLAIQIEGSGRVILEDGTPLRTREEISPQRIREWMTAHPDEAEGARREPFLGWLR
jgi:membrane-bound lytic murein transglycosylase A